MASDPSRLTVPAIHPILDGRAQHLCYGTFPPALEVVVETSLTRDRSMRLHLLAVNKMAHIWGQQLAFTEGERSVFARAALLHDVGKILIPDSIVSKPSALTADEYSKMKEHVKLGVTLIVGQAPELEVEATVVAQHHEWYDGSGYPAGLAGDQIHPIARALAIIDAFSAMTDERPYTTPRSKSDALDELERFAGTQFDPTLVESFVQMKRERVPRSIYGSNAHA